jgi:hypothetical protein
LEAEAIGFARSERLAKRFVVVLLDQRTSIIRQADGRTKGAGEDVAGDWGGADYCAAEVFIEAAGEEVGGRDISRRELLYRVEGESRLIDSFHAVHFNAPYRAKLLTS